MPSGRLRAVEPEQLRALVAEGLNTSELRARTGYSPTGLRSALKRQGLTAPAPPRPRATVPPLVVVGEHHGEGTVYPLCLIAVLGVCAECQGDGVVGVVVLHKGDLGLVHLCRAHGKQAARALLGA